MHATDAICPFVFFPSPNLNHSSFTAQIWTLSLETLVLFRVRFSQIWPQHGHKMAHWGRKWHIFQYEMMIDAFSYVLNTWDAHLSDVTGCQNGHI